ncbi:hypothetical protein VIBNIAM115_1190049 [Vibrio nigripulchritudo AM115]|nr:hypothetical protein VIBNIAM115_1190049 [Vibrio nigripulchritudo AM115]
MVINGGVWLEIAFFCDLDLKALTLTGLVLLPRRKPCSTDLVIVVARFLRITRTHFGEYQYGNPTH